MIYIPLSIPFSLKNLISWSTCLLMTNFHCVFYWNAFVLYGFFSLLLNSGSCFLYFSASFLKSSHFCLHASNIFSLPSVFSCWNMMCLSMVFFVLILFGLTGLISFRIEWLDLLVVQETLKSLLQYQSSKASILWCLVFLMVQISHP